MTYEHNTAAYSSEERQNRRSADLMSVFFLVIMALWVAGAAVMFLAAWKGTTISSVAQADSTLAGSAPPTEADGAMPAQ